MSRDRSYAELVAVSNFTFLTGASHPEELVEQAAGLGYRGVAIADTNTVAGIVRGHVAAKTAGVPYIVGSTICLTAGASTSVCDGLCISLYPTGPASYGRLCRLLTVGKRRVEKGRCHLELHDVLEHSDELVAIAHPPQILDEAFLEVLMGLKSRFDEDRLSLAMSCTYRGDDRSRLRQLASVSTYTGVPAVATNRPLYHRPSRRALQDVVSCIREGCTLATAGYRLQPNAERHLKAIPDLAGLFVEYPGSIDRTLQIADRVSGFSLDQLKYQYPDEVCPAGQRPIEYLCELSQRGMLERYPDGVPTKVRQLVQHELKLIDELDYAPYFLTVHDLVAFARSQRILCQGRGAAANSAVCYCLGVTAVDPDRIDLLFERFVSKERDEPPDIDIDFEHERREEVIQYIYGKYGRERAALTAEVISYRGRSAIREVGKVLGLSLDCVDGLAKNMEWWHDRVINEERFAELGINPRDPTIRRVMSLVQEILGFPRHLSQHVGGFVITRGPLCELVPVENAAMPDRTVIEWDKDDIDAMGMLKVDCLGLGMLTCIRKTMSFVNQLPGPRRGPERLELHTIPPEDEVVYDMICAADTLGVFQIESRAQMSMLPRLRPRCFYDLVIEVAIVRPGPIQGDMVHPYLRRRNGEEPVSFPSEDVRDVLGKTLGVPLFQEQAMALAIVAAGFSPGEADQLRRAMAAWKRKGNLIELFGQRLIKGMLEKGYARDFAERCFAQIKGFSEYGFPESHAASFALLVYVSCWLKKHEPAAFAAALINSQPMGFYAPAQIVRDAQEHGVAVLPVDVNYSSWDCTLEAAAQPSHAPASSDRLLFENESTTVETSTIEPGEQGTGCLQPAIRLGMRLIKGLRKDHANDIEAAVSAARGEVVIDGTGEVFQEQRYHPRQRSIAMTSVNELWKRSGVPVATMRRLAGADAFGSMGLDRQQALWQVRALRDDRLPMFEDLPVEENKASLPKVPPLREVMHDYGAIHLSLKNHPMSFLREELDRRSVIRAEQLADESRCPSGRHVSVAGVALVRQRPSTAKGVVFITLEDETGIANLILRPAIYDRYRKSARHGVVILSWGQVERQGEVVHVMVKRMEDLDERLRGLTKRSRDFH